jgi:hypothetical protein
MRVVLDTNVLISALFFAGLPSRILAAWIDERFDDGEDTDAGHAGANRPWCLPHGRSVRPPRGPLPGVLHVMIAAIPTSSGTCRTM